MGHRRRRVWQPLVEHRATAERHEIDRPRIALAELAIQRPLDGHRPNARPELGAVATDPTVLLAIDPDPLRVQVQRAQRHGMRFTLDPCCSLRKLPLVFSVVYAALLHGLALELHHGSHGLLHCLGQPLVLRRNFHHDLIHGASSVRCVATSDGQALRRLSQVFVASTPPPLRARPPPPVSRGARRMRSTPVISASLDEREVCAHHAEVELLVELDEVERIDPILKSALGHRQDF